MGLSSQLAPSAIAKPGVVANAAARPASPYDGQVIYQQDTDQAYVWNGSAWVLLSTGTANPPGLEHIVTHTFSGASSPTGVNGCFSATYDHYKILISVGTSASTDLRWRVRYGTSTVETGNVYDTYGFSVTGTPTVLSGQSLNADKAYLIDSYLGTPDRSIAHMEFFNPYVAVNAVASTRAWGSNSGYVRLTDTRIESTTQYTGFELLSDTGTLTGNFSVYGYRK